MLNRSSRAGHLQPGAAGLAASTRPMAPAVPTVGGRQVGLGVVGVVLVLGFGLLVTPRAAWSSGELPVVVWLSAHHAAALGSVAAVLAVVLSPATGLVWLALAGGLAARRRGWRYGVLLFLIGGADLAGAVVVKLLVRRPRPDVTVLAHPPAVDHSFSYPSGHTVVATVVVLALVMATGRQHARWTVPLGAVVVLVAATSRVYLGVHFPSDVVAAVVYGVSAVPVLVGVTGTPPARAVLGRLKLVPPSAPGARPEGASL